MFKADYGLSWSALIPPRQHHLSKVNFLFTLYQGHRRPVNPVRGRVGAGSVGTVESESYRIRLNNKLNTQGKYIRYNQNKQKESPSLRFKIN